MGDDRPGTFDEAARRWHGLVLRIARRLWRPAVVRAGVPFDDLYGAALVGLWRAWRSWTPVKGPWRLYAAVVTRSRAIDWLRRATGWRRPARARVLSLDRACAGDPDGDDYDRPNRERTPAGGLLAPDEPDAVEAPARLLAYLTPKQADAVRRRYWTPGGTTTPREWELCANGQDRLRELGPALVRELLGVA